MIHICRAENGHLFQTNATLRDIERAGNLELFIHQETGLDQDAVLAYLADGRRLTNTNVRDVASAQDQTIYVFSKYYLDYELDDILNALRVTPILQPAVEESIPATPPFRPSQLAASYLRTARLHHEQVNQTLISLHYQHEAIRIASISLDLHVLAICDTFDSIANNSGRELTKQALLLEGLEADLELISRVKIHAEFMSNAVRRAIESGDPHRTLGDYVSNTKMRQVGEACMRTHDDLSSRFQFTEQVVLKLKEGTDVVRASVSDRRLLEDAEACFKKSQSLVEKITDCAASLESLNTNSDLLLHELRQMDNALREEVHIITDIKNAYTEQCMIAVRRVSTLNSDVVQVPPALTALQASFRTKNSFSHIQRLHNMLFAYGATVIEIVRRKEFARFFFQRAQSILEVMAKFSAAERTRRQVYRSDVHGQLPFETRGLDDDPVPTIDFSPTGSTDAVYSLERGDVTAFMQLMDDLERYAKDSNDEVALRSISDCRASLQKLVVKMENLETGFERLAERSLLSASRLSMSRRRSLEAEEQAFQELAVQLQKTQDAKMHQEAMFQEERRTLQAETQRLRKSLEEANSAASSEQDRSNRLERELHQVRAHLEGEAKARRVLEGRNADLAADIDSQRISLERALADATEKSRQAEMLRQEIAQVKAESEEVKALETKNAAKVVALLEEQANNLRKLEDARARGEDLQAQIRNARSESSEVHQALKEASQEKDRLLKAQASEHDRMLRDHRAEADGDRAVLERQFFELKAVVENKDRMIKDLKAEVEVANADAVGLREELQRVEHELRDARHVERILRDDLRTGQVSQSDFEQHLEENHRLIAQIMDVAITFRNSHIKAMSSAQVITSHMSSTRHMSSTNIIMGESAFSSGVRHSIIGHGHNEEPDPIDPSDPTTALEILRGFDHDHFLEAIAKTGSTIRKWQKQCKEYRERAKGKISFRNFAKGDLALFLPTRNSVSKPWAAFNVSFPHYFLQATGHLAEQLKTREWIVARITSITERIVDHQDPTSNPYGLGDGVKYYMLEVEDWTQPTQNKRRASSRKISIEKNAKDGTPIITPMNSPPSLPPVIASGPPEAEVEETFRVTHPPNSQYFPVRARSNSSPGARPSSLSRLLAQAPENQIEGQHAQRHELVDDEHLHESYQRDISSSPPRDTPSPQLGSFPMHTSPPRRPSPSLAVISSIPQSLVANQASPLRPGSRASRMSTTSKFSGRIPIIGSSPVGAKAPPTTALVDQALISSSPSNDGNPFGSPVTPSPEGSISEGMSNILQQSRRRTTSYHIPRSSPLAGGSSSQSTLQPAKPVLTAANTLASLASNWGVSFGRRKKPDAGSLPPPAESPPPEDTRGSSDRVTSETSARDLLKRL